MINANNGQVAEISTQETALVVITRYSHTVLHVVRLNLGQYGHTAISLLLGREEIGFIAQGLELQRRDLFRLSFGFLQTDDIRLLRRQPVREAFRESGSQSIHVVGDNFHSHIICLLF